MFVPMGKPFRLDRIHEPQPYPRLAPGLCDCYNLGMASTDKRPTLDGLIAGISPPESVRNAKFEDLSWRDTLGAIGPHLRSDLAIDRIEEMEAILKRCLREKFSKPVDGGDARFLAQWSQSVGFIMKYKPYGVKCATPFGYSIFLLNPGEGFSFQRHLTRKTEIFHIIQPLEDARVFLCSSEQWERTYDPASFAAWLHGKSEPKYDNFSRRPEAGDVYHVDELGVVHTVLGCILEEFATVSTDMVDRLHDQNASRSASPVSVRADVVERLRSLPSHMPCLARWPSGTRAEPLAIRDAGDGEVVEISGEGVIRAERYRATRGSTVKLPFDGARATTLFFLNGHGSMELRSKDERGSMHVPAISFTPGDTFTIAPAIDVALRADDDFSMSSHRVGVSEALA